MGRYALLAACVFSFFSCARAQETDDAAVAREAAALPADTPSIAVVPMQEAVIPGKPGGPDIYFLTRSEELTKDDVAEGSGRYLDNKVYIFKKGDKLQLRLESPDYNVCIALIEPGGKMTLQGDKRPRKGNSYMEWNYTVPADGTYQVMLTSLEPRTTGRYTFSAYRADSAIMAVPANAGLCWKLHYLLKQAVPNFGLIKDTVLAGRGSGYAIFKSSFSLLDGGAATIIDSLNGKHVYQMSLSISDAQAEDAFVSRLKECLGSEWTFSEKHYAMDTGDVHMLEGTPKSRQTGLHHLYVSEKIMPVATPYKHLEFILY